MLTYQSLPDHIKKVAGAYNYSNEKIDCLPSKLHYEGNVYYVIEYEPSLHELFVYEDGEVAPFEEVRRATLIVRAYQTGGNSLMQIGGRWLKAPTLKRYRKLQEKLKTIKEKIGSDMPDEALNQLNRVMNAAKSIVEDQELIFDCVSKGTDLIVKANETEMVTEQIQKEVRMYVVEVARAAVRQNQVQLDTEMDRRNLLAFLDKVALKKPSILMSYLWFKKNEPNMLNSKTEMAKEMPMLKEMVKEDTPIDQLENAEELIALIRNPK